MDKAHSGDDVVLSLDEVFALSKSVLVAAGLTEAQAAPLARVLTEGQRDECHSHGLFRLPGCVQTIHHPRFNRDAVPDVTDTTAAVTRVDAQFGFSLPALEAAMPRFVEKARAIGISVLAINNCFHITALWPEIERLTAQGLVAIAMTPSHSWVAPAGGTKGALGTNPIAFGWPREGQEPYVFDFATSAIARGDISLHKMAGKPLKEGWAFDADGNPTTSAAAALEGAMLTFGGHKGSALSTMIELLAGPLIADMTSLESMDFDDGLKAAPCHGEILIAFDPAILGGGSRDNQASSERLFSAIADQGARLPSTRRYAARARSLANGVHVPRHLYEQIMALPRAG
ncbi:oxidoreductase [Kaistia sp. 32K]|uniref:Ldh family oxidoreductase n=1 Tax=Kaistia sp. 32K TaxID=2795690 RepID=UPI0019168924|nr:Ldh family oxidoreductase [Kaistia sp. 32K]BCP54622.1 oxidoreductase [Kaistia sp. 32K]